MSIVEDDVWKSFVTSIVSENYSQSDDVLSPEDLAWVDSCLVKDPELSEDNWNAMKDALFDIITSDEVLNDDNSVVVVENDGMQRGMAMDFLMSEEREVRNNRSGDVGFTEGDNVLGVTALSLGEENDELLASITETAESEEGCLQGDRSKIRKFRTKGKKAEDDPESSLVNDSESPFEDDLFKVWDLNTSVYEEDELSVELEKVFKENPLQSEQLALNDSFNNLDIGALDDIISGLADMSLHPLSGS